MRTSPRRITVAVAAVAAVVAVAAPAQADAAVRYTSVLDGRGGPEAGAAARGSAPRAEPRRDAVR